MEFSELRILAHRRRLEVAVDDLEGDTRWNPLRELALRPLDIKRVGAHLHGDALGQRNRFFSNS
jgi:hypothetical protein